MENFFVAANAVIPFLCYLSFGYLVVQKQVVSEEFMQKLNQMVFRLFFPCMTFYNIYKADHSEVPSVKLLVFLAAGILLTEAVLLLTVPRLVGENCRRGVLIQAIYRSNFILFGMPLTVSVFGDWASSAAAMVITEVTTIFNITSVMILELFHGEGKTSPAVLLKGLIKNPLLQGAVVGLIFFFFHLRLPECIVEPIAAFSSMISPLALFILGGTIHFDALGGQPEISGAIAGGKARPASCRYDRSGLDCRVKGAGTVFHDHHFRHSRGDGFLPDGAEHGRGRGTGGTIRGNQHGCLGPDVVFLDLFYERYRIDLRI